MVTELFTEPANRAFITAIQAESDIQFTAAIGAPVIAWPTTSFATATTVPATKRISFSHSSCHSNCNYCRNDEHARTEAV